MDDFLNKNFILSYEEYLNEQIDKYLTTLTPEEKEAKLKELLLNAKLKEQGISSTIADDKDFKKVTVPPKNDGLVEFPRMQDIPGYSEIEKRIEKKSPIKEEMADTIVETNIPVVEEKNIDKEIQTEELENENIQKEKVIKEPTTIEQTPIVEKPEIKIEEDNDPNTASIYRQDALSAVRQDLEEQKERVSIHERTTEIISEPIEEKVEVKDKHKTLTLEKNDPWGNADGIKHVTPGQNI